MVSGCHATMLGIALLAGHGLPGHECGLLQLDDQALI